MSKVTLWAIWLLGTIGLSTVLTIAIPSEDSASSLSTVFVPGETTHGHYQIEMNCAACHETGGEVNEQSCRDCHADELKQARDTHPESKFRDPTKAKLLEHVDARRCVSCHREHDPHRTSGMGLTLPKDYCFHCHQSIAEDRPSHAAFTYDSCSTVGCHNYHDNTALYENFLLKHLDEPSILENALLPLRSSGPSGSTDTSASGRSLGIEDHDAFSSKASDKRLDDWAMSAHARAGVNCSGCHQPEKDGERAAWSDSVTHETCGVCHSQETNGFLSGRHGMRLSVGLSPMSPNDARLPMTGESQHRSLTCNSCHPAHRYDTRTAAVASCLACHDDQHSRAYVGSSHHRLWEREQTGKAPRGSGVSCASCHLPRIDDGDVRVNHNQNDTLRPVEKMVRNVCLNCHGLQFSLDALADPDLKDECYSTAPQKRVESLEMARDWFERKSNKRRTSIRGDP